MHAHQGILELNSDLEGAQDLMFEAHLCKDKPHALECAPEYDQCSGIFVIT